MRIGLVIGKISLKQVHPSLTGKRYVLTLPQSLGALDGRDSPAPEELVLVDELGATPGALLGFSDGGEAAVPYLPERKPVDGYVACLLDEINLDRGRVSRLLDGNNQ